MAVTTREFRRLVQRYGGWCEDGRDEIVAQFPSVHQKDQFLAALDEAERLSVIDLKDDSDE